MCRSARARSCCCRHACRIHRSAAADTVGLVIERERRAGELDGFQWYCENCGQLLYEEFLAVTDIEKELPPLFERFYSSEARRTCARCGMQSCSAPHARSSTTHEFRSATLSTRAAWTRRMSSQAFASASSCRTMRAASRSLTSAATRSACCRAPRARSSPKELDDWGALGVLGHESARRPWIPYHENLTAGLAQLTGASRARSGRDEFAHRSTCT
jgi:hypothetical protein